MYIYIAKNTKRISKKILTTGKGTYIQGTKRRYHEKYIV